MENSDAVIAKYTTLSHCWGRHVALTTTTATLEDRKQGITMDRPTKDVRRCGAYHPVTGCSISLDRLALYIARFEGRLGRVVCRDV